MSPRAVSLVYACILMAAFGIGVAAFGPLLPEFADHTGLSMGDLGLIFPAIFIGTVPASLAVGFAIDRIGAYRIILMAIPVLAGSAIGLTFSRTLPLLIALSVLIGAGGGAGIPTANALIVKLFGKRSVAAVNLLNVFFGIGAITGPALVSLGLGVFGTGVPTFWFAAAVALACTPYFLRVAARTPVSVRAGPSRNSNDQSPAEERHAAAPLLFHSPLLWLIGILLFFDVGTEQTLGGWMTVYMQESTSIALATAALVVSGFWITFTAGRLAGAAIGTRISARWVLAASLAAALLGILAVNLSTGRVVLSIAGFFLTGFGLGPVYPTTMAMIGSLFAARAGTAIGATAALGTVGGMALPWLEGVLMSSHGPPAAVRLLFVTVAAIALFSFSVIFSIVRRSRIGSRNDP